MPTLFLKLIRRFKKCPRVGMVLIVRDEARFLDTHLRYHRWLGIERAYCYEHRCIDSSGEIAARFPWVQRIVLKGQCPDKEAYIAELHRHCMNDALERARQEGLDWLLIIDADEFAVPGKKPRRNGLSMALRALPHTTIEARLRAREVVACAKFGDANWHQNPFFALPERTPHSLGNGTEWTGHLGHVQGQRLVRTKAPVQAYDSHRWTAAEAEASEGMPAYRPLPYADIGWHAHYYLASPEHWLEKFTRHNDFPSHWPAPASTEGNPAHHPLEEPVAVWRQCVAQLEKQPGAALTHAKSQLFRSADALIQLARNAGKPLVEVDHSLPEALRFIREHPAQPSRTPVSPTSPVIHLAIGSLPTPPTLKPAEVDLCNGNLLFFEVLLHGFHHWQGLNRTPYRWSEPDAKITGVLPAGQYRLNLRFRLKRLRQTSVSELQLRASGQTIRLKRRFLPGWFSGMLNHSGGEFTLQLQAAEIKVDGDSRRLGLPLHAVYITPISDTP